MAKEVQFPVRKLAYLTEEMAHDLSEYRHSNRIPSENEAIRRLIHLGIKAEPILLDLLRMMEHLRRTAPAPELDKHIADIKGALGA